VPRTLKGLLVLLSVAAAAAPAHARRGELHHYEATRLSMACVYAIELYGPDAQNLPSVVNDAFDEVDRIDRLMSHYKADSPLSRINREAGRHAVPVEPELFDFIADAMRYTRQSDGAFDITVGRLMKAWGFFRGEGRMPSAGELADARRVVGAAHVLLDAQAKTIRFDKPGVELDLGGIAKGYAVDRAAGVLRARGISSALISAGGSTIYALGAPPGREGWDIAIQDPIDTRKEARTVQLKDRALSVAGSSEKAFEFEGVRYSHIMDPRSGRPVQGMLSVAVLASSGTQGDALDDAFFVLGPTRSPKYSKQWPGVEVLFFKARAAISEPHGEGSQTGIWFHGRANRRM
jgi:thiamine biosynthesis lipoprotein